VVTTCCALAAEELDLLARQRRRLLGQLLDQPADGLTGGVLAGHPSSSCSVCAPADVYRHWHGGKRQPSRGTRSAVPGYICFRLQTRRRGMASVLVAPVAALGLGWIGTIIVVILLIILLTRLL
jgi:hypothetical protein